MTSRGTSSAGSRIVVSSESEDISGDSSLIGSGARFVLRLRLRGLFEFEASLWSSFLMSHGRLLIVCAKLKFVCVCEGCRGFVICGFGCARNGRGVPRKYCLIRPITPHFTKRQLSPFVNTTTTTTTTGQPSRSRNTPATAKHILHLFIPFLIFSAVYI